MTKCRIVKIISIMFLIMKDEFMVKSDILSRNLVYSKKIMTKSYIYIYIYIYRERERERERESIS